MLHQHASGDVVPIRELPYRPAAIIAASEAGQMAASDYAPNTPNTACVTRGVHRWEADITATGVSLSTLRRGEAAGKVSGDAGKSRFLLSAQRLLPPLERKAFEIFVNVHVLAANTFFLDERKRGRVDPLEVTEEALPCDALADDAM